MMKRFLLVTALAAMTAPVLARAEVGVSVEVGHPGFYGRIDIGGFPPPPLIFPEPVIINHVHVVGPPVYLHVPPGHAKDWAKHCAHYGACGQRVFFVQDRWYDDVYVPAYQKRHGGGHGEGHGGHGEGGHGNNHGEGHGKGHGHQGH